ncbi:MAG: hypothetical protein JW864_07565 [Spirochaetes bacterium]|nr:hypothetical protein [Spirochaetota bacterium]
MKALIIIAAVIVFLILIYLIQPRSRKLFIKNLLKQLFYLFPRYFT